MTVRHRHQDQGPNAESWSASESTDCIYTFLQTTHKQASLFFTHCNHQFICYWISNQALIKENNKHNTNTNVFSVFLWWNVVKIHCFDVPTFHPFGWYFILNQILTLSRLWMWLLEVFSSLTNSTIVMHGPEFTSTCVGLNPRPCSPSHWLTDWWTPDQ